MFVMVKISHPNCKKCRFWVFSDSIGFHCESGFRPLVRDDWSYDCREMAESNRRARQRYLESHPVQLIINFRWG